MTKLGLLEADDDNNLIEIETKSDRRTAANVLELRSVDKRKNNIIRLGTMVHFNLKIDDEGDKSRAGSETVTVRKAIKAVPAIVKSRFALI